MALIEDLTALRADFDGYKADVAAKLNAVAVQIAQLQEQILNGDPEARVLVATIKADIDEARVVVGDANEDGDPATSAPEPEPTP